jgi:histidinol-phosphate aminotransferase
MSIPFSRRHFLGGSVAVAGALATVGTALPARAASAGPNGTSALPLFGPAPGVAKLNANENPYGPSERARAAMADAGAQGAYYVGESIPRLKAMIAERNGVDPSWVTLGSGSSGVLTALAVAASREGRILAPDLYWDTTVQKAVAQGAAAVQLPKTADLGIDLDAMSAALDSSIGLVHITNPNNPTGLVLPADALRAFCRRASAKAIVLVDEAYNELTDDPERNSMVDLVREGRNVAVARTFSKIYGLAGMRIGYLIAPPPISALAERFGLGDYAMNQAGVAAAIASYDDETFVRYSKARILEGRELVLEAIRSAGLEALPSGANFLFVNLGTLDAEAFRTRMAERKVLVRGIYRDYTHWSRVSMGRIEDLERYAAALPAVLDELGA